MDTTITDQHGTVIGHIRPVRLAHRETGAAAITYTDAFAADVLNHSGTGWINPAPDGRTHYPTAEEAHEAILAARAKPAPKAPKGLRLGANQKHALWVATLADGQVDDKHAPALEKKGLAVDTGFFRYRLTDLGYEAARALFDEDGNPR